MRDHGSPKKVSVVWRYKLEIEPPRAPEDDHGRQQTRNQAPRVVRKRL